MTRNRMIFNGIILLLIFVVLFLWISTRQSEETPEGAKESNTELETIPLENSTSTATTTDEQFEEEIAQVKETNETSKPAVKTEEKKENIEPVPKIETETKSVEIKVDVSRILAAHNIARTEVGITPLTYSATLAASAQKWSEELSSNDCKIKHDPSTPYGENLYWASKSGNLKDGLIASPETVVGSWVDEKNDYNYSKNSCASGKVCGHYTQIVWENTREVGCGVSICRSGNTQKEVWVCRYNPAGNYIGEKPY